MNGEEGIQVFDSGLHGHGVKTLRSFAKDSVLYIEKPRFFLQTLANRPNALVCSNCARFIGSVGLQFKYLQRLFDRQTLLQTPSECLGDPLHHLTEVCPCGLQCGEYYCSEECRQVHWDVKGHRFLCFGTLYQDTATESPLFQFKTFCVQTNEIFLMIASMIAEICCFLDSEGIKDPAESARLALSRYESYVHELWWDVATLSVKQKKEKARLEKSLKGLVKDATELLSATFHLKDRGLDGVFTKDLISRTIGMFEQNNIGVRLSNPITTFMQNNLQEEDVRLAEVADAVNCTFDLMDEEADLCGSECDEGSEEEDEGEDAAAAVEEENSENSEGEEEEEEEEEEDSTAGKVTSDVKSTEVTTKTQLLELVEQLGGSETLFPPLDGTAFYMTTCKINHSCSPSVYVRYTTHEHLGLVAELVALRDIAEGEELMQSYIDQSMSTTQRQKALVDYGFRCTCERCTTGK